MVLGYFMSFHSNIELSGARGVAASFVKDTRDQSNSKLIVIDWLWYLSCKIWKYINVCKVGVA